MSIVSGQILTHLSAHICPQLLVERFVADGRAVGKLVVHDQLTLQLRDFSVALLELRFGRQQHLGVDARARRDARHAGGEAQRREGLFEGGLISSYVCDKHCLAVAAERIAQH
eukprot:scaffold19458_cov112-Isochrysis_galbana.AAC.2